jgi:hypothetical protein
VTGDDRVGQIGGRVRGASSDRGQFVLLAGVVVAVALVAMLTAYLQLGYHADVTASGSDRAVTDSTAFLDRATHTAARPLRGKHDWGHREAAVTAVRDRLRPRLATLERARVTQGVVVRAAFALSAADTWADDHCPGGSAGSERAFGPCVADRGVVVQERDGRTLVLAVGYDLNLTTRDGTAELTTVINATG